MAHAVPGPKRRRPSRQALRAAGGDLRVVQVFFGRAKPVMTAIYTFVEEDEIRTVVDTIAPPLF